MHKGSQHARTVSVTSMHSLQHRFVSHALSHCMNLESAQLFAAYNSLDTISTYATAKISW